MATDARYTLWLNRDDGTQESFPLTASCVLIVGRGPDCDIRLQDPHVSWKHAAIRLKDGRVLVEDLISTNGSFIDEHRIEQAEWVPGQSLSIRENRFQLVPRGGEPSPLYSSEHTIHIHANERITLRAQAQIAPDTAAASGGLPLLEWLRDYRKELLRGDLIAGITVAFVVIPQGIAFAMLAGLPPIMGLYAALLPMLVYALLGSSRHLSVGPVSLDSIIVAAGLGALLPGSEGEYIAMAMLLACMAGMIQLALGLLRMGIVVNFLSRPVITGFTIAAAVIIGVSQLRPLLGLDAPREFAFLQMLEGMALNLHSLHPFTTAVGLASVLALWLLKRFLPSLPGPLLLMLAFVLLSQWLDFETMGIAVVGSIPVGLPKPALPQFSMERLMELLPLALTLALIGFAGAISVAKSFARQKGYSIRPNQELAALGLSNLAAGLTQAYSVTGGFSRTAVNARAGANTQLSSIISVILLALVVSFLAYLFETLPVAALAAVILVSVGSLIDMGEVRHLFRVKRSEGWLLLFTIVATLLLGITQGLLAGVAASVLLYMILNTRPPTALLGKLPGTDIYRNVRQFPEAEQVACLIILRIDAAFYFVNAEFIKDHIRQLVENREEPLRAIILDASSVTDLDSSADASMHFLCDYLKQRGVEFYIAGVKSPVREVMKRSGLYDVLGGDHFFFTIDAAVQRYCRDCP